MAADRFRLKIRYDGEIRYYCTDGDFWNINNNRTAELVYFGSRQEAKEAFLKWVMKYPAIASDWIFEVEEA